MRTVIVAGAFDPLHFGHVRHIQLAKMLGDKLIVIINPDADLIRKKGYVFLPLEQRKAIVEALKSVDEVVVAIDGDGTVAKTIEMIKQRTSDEFIFAKGGDRVPGTLPDNEVKVCEKLGINLVYGVGDKLDSSQEIVSKVLKQIGGNL